MEKLDYLGDKDRLIVAGRLIDHDNERQGAVVIDRRTGFIEEVKADISDADIQFDAKHHLIFPGFVDNHVHTRQDPSGKGDHKETFRTASEAAINGGVVHIVSQPNVHEAPIDNVRMAALVKLAETSLVPTTLYAGIGPDTQPLDNISLPAEQVKDRQYVLHHIYKAFMGPSVGDLFFEDNAELFMAMGRYAGERVTFHCEDPELLEKHKDAKTHEARRPRECEYLAIPLVGDISRQLGIRANVAHLTTREGLEAVLTERRKGATMSCEVSPAHLYFHTGMLHSGNIKFFQVNPPIRKNYDCDALIRGLKMGDIDMLATDHAPHTWEEKLEGVSGLPHLDTYGSIAAWLMTKHGFSPQDIARVCSYNPGGFIEDATTEKYGRIEPGFTGSLTVLCDDPWTVKREDIRSKCGWSPFEGYTLPGRVAMTIVKGQAYRP